MVAKDCAQKPGIDYTDTHAPVAQMESTQVLLHIGASLVWEIHQMDVKAAFLHGNLEEEVFMEQPEGMKKPGKEIWECSVHKTLWANASCECMEPCEGDTMTRPLLLSEILRKGELIRYVSRMGFLT